MSVKEIRGSIVQTGSTMTLDSGGNTTAITSNSPAGNITLTLPNVTDTLIGRATTDTLTNKSIDADTNTITNIKNADIKAGAAIALNKLASVTASRVLVSDGSGVVSASSVTSTTLGYLDATSSIQTQLNAKEPTLPLTTRGDILIRDSLNATARLAVGAANTVLKSDGTDVAYGLIVNANIDASAAIDASKIADGSVSSTEFQYINSLTSNAQTQLNAKEPTLPLTTRGDILVRDSLNTTARLAIGAANTVLKSDGTDISYGLLANANIDASAAIAYSKLALSNSIVNGDVNTSAAIAQSKIANLTTDLAAKLDDVGTATDNALVRFDTDGTALQNSGVIVDDSNNITGAASLAMGGAKAASAILDLQSTSQGMLSPRMTTAQRDAIGTPATGLQIFNTTTNAINVYNGTSWEAPAILGIGDNSAVHSVSSADYTILDNDGYRTILVTTGASDRTITLPTAADNTNRSINIIKVDSGAGNVIVDGEGAETINGATTVTISAQYGGIDLVCNGTSWNQISGLATSTSSGLVKGGQVPGDTSGSAIASGYIGETVRNSGAAGSVNLSNLNWVNTRTLTIPSAGVWECAANVQLFNVSGFSAVTAIQSCLSLYSDNTTTDHEAFYNLINFQVQSTSVPTVLTNFVPSFFVYATGATTVYLKTYINATFTSIASSGAIQAVRVG